MTDWVRRLYAKVDAMDAKGYANAFTPDCTLTWGNSEPIHGPASVENAIAGFFGSIAGLRHEFVNIVEHGDEAILEARVHYTRKDGKSVIIPGATFYRRKGDKIASASVYIDLAPLYA